MSRSRTALLTRRTGLLFVLVVLVWSRLWTGVPVSVTHSESDLGHGSHETVEHLASLDHGATHGDESPDHAGTDASPDAGDDHHHHLHACSAGCVALVGADFGLALSATADPILYALGHQPSRPPEQLLRPPRA